MLDLERDVARGLRERERGSNLKGRGDMANHIFSSNI